MDLLKFTVSGTETLDDEITEFMPRVEKSVTAGLRVLQSDMKNALIGYIERDVYEAYEPIEYKRRLYNPELGTPLIGEENFNGSSVNGTEMLFVYNPDGTNTAADPETGERLYYSDTERSGNALIEVLETGEGYTWQPQGVGERPFWTNFVFDWFLGGQAQQSLVHGINMADSDLKAAPDGNRIIADSNDIYNQ